MRDGGGDFLEVKISLGWEHGRGRMRLTSVTAKEGDTIGPTTMAEKLQSPWHLPEVLEDPLALVAQEPGSQREVVLCSVKVLVQLRSQEDGIATTDQDSTHPIGDLGQELRANCWHPTVLTRKHFQEMFLDHLLLQAALGHHLASTGFVPCCIWQGKE